MIRGSKLLNALAWTMMAFVFGQVLRVASNLLAYVALTRADIMATNSVVKLIAAVITIAGGYHLFGLTGALLAVSFHAVAPVAYMLWAKRELGLFDVRYEILVLLAWPIGFAAGHLTLITFDMIRGYWS